MDVRNKKVIVTGGVSGLGRSMVDELLSREAIVRFSDLMFRVERVGTEHDALNCVECDVSNYEQVSAAIDRYHEQFGAADVLINNAGILYSAPLVKITPTGVERHDMEMWNKVLASDLSSVFYMTACVVEKMVMARTRGVIVNISSVSASGNAGQSAYQRQSRRNGANCDMVEGTKLDGNSSGRQLLVSPATESTSRLLATRCCERPLRRFLQDGWGSPKKSRRECSLS
jgi:3-oxoacyl-[acyl-carrier protein] reductase